jgi:hypothetical protein
VEGLQAFVEKRKPAFTGQESKPQVGRRKGVSKKQRAGSKN